MEIMSEFENPDTDLDGAEEVQPWWKNPLNRVILGAALLIGLLAFGYRWGNSNGGEEFNKVDVGFLQDMRVHHEQAVTMSMLYIESAANTDPLLREIAREIIVDQSIDNGRMIQLLRIFGEPEANETDIGMAWMSMSSPLEMMQGMATDEELRLLASASGDEADNLFIELMIAHHEGGIHMAEYAMSNADNDEVIKMATGTVAAQQSEIIDLEKQRK